MSANHKLEIGFVLGEHAELTDVGVRRSHNQDNYGILLANSQDVWRERGHLFIVADGMGAHAVGELASEMAADLIVHTYQKNSQMGPGPALKKAFVEANERIHQRGQQNREFHGMGTTSTALVVRPEGAWVAHVGDSRAYRIRDQVVEQLSFDHSLQWELARRQQVSPDRIAGVPSNVIVRSLGPEATVQVDIEGPHPVRPGDVYLLCSDGLSNQLTDQELGAIVTHLPLEESCRFLVDLANLRGGPDNITVVTARVAGQPPAAATESKPQSTLLALMRPWLYSLTGATLLMTVGVGAAILALYLVLSNLAMLAVLIFVLAFTTFLAGVFGMIQHYRLEEQPPSEGTEDGRLRVYRHTSCAVDAALLEKTMQTEQHLHELILEKHWQVDEKKYKAHRLAAQNAFKAGDLSTAFREQCRAFGLLMAVLREHRVKDETFKPNW
jgi:protein phosphatase